MKIARDTHTLYGWEVSYFTGKIRSYLRRKGIGFVEVRPTLFDYYFTLPARTGATAIPVLRTPQGQWLQDSSAIIDHLETAFPDNPVLPAGPAQRLATFLLELWGDEFWLPSGLSTRWTHMAENYPFLERDVADNLLPGWPGPVQRLAVRQVARHMYLYLPKTGVTPDQYEVLDRWTETSLDLLDRHFAEHDFLLGGRASLGDFGVMGPLYAHLSRDPWPRDRLIAPRKHIGVWLDRMNQTPAAGGHFLAGDDIPATLEPILRSIATEMTPYLTGMLEVARPYLARGGPLPRFIEPVSFPMAGGTFTRPGMPYGLWMLQRMLDDWRAMAPADAARGRAWAEEIGAGALFALDLPRLERRGLGVAAG